MKQFITFIIALCVFFTITSTAQPLNGTYTIDNAGGSDYISFSEAIDSLIAKGVSGPVIFDVKNGQYQERFTIPAISGVSDSNTITFQSESGDSTAVLLWDSATSNLINYVIRLDAANQITFKGITFKSMDYQYKRIFHIINSSSFISLMSCIFISPRMTSSFGGPPANKNYSTLVVDETEHTSIEIHNCQFYRGRTAIWFDNSFSLDHRATKITNNTFNNQYYVGIHIKGLDDSLYSNVTSNAFITNDTTSTGYTAIWFEEILANFVVDKNYFDIKWGYAIYGSSIYPTFEITANIMIKNNLVIVGDSTDNWAIGINLTSIGFASRFIKVYNNTVITKSMDPTRLNHAPIYLYEIIQPDIRNNNFINLGFGPSAIYTNCDFSSWNKLGNNNYQISDSGYALIDTNGTLFLTIGDWQTATNLDSNSVSVNPMFLGSNDYRPCANALWEGGVMLAEVSDDINDITRYSPPTIGAYEVASTKLALNDTSFCLGQTLTLSSDAPNADLLVWTNKSTGDADSSIAYVISSAGLYTHEAFNVCGSTLDSMTVTENILPSISMQDTSTCDTSCLIFNLPGITSAIWSPGTGLSDSNATNVTACPTQTITYTVNVLDSNGCMNTDSFELIVIPCLVSGVINNLIYTASSEIYPNPSSGILNVLHKNFSENTIIEISSIEGRKLMSFSTTNEYNRLDLNSLENGVYLIKILSSQLQQVEKIIITK